MASSYDLQEQEQLAQIKHFWARYGNFITWLLVAVLGAFAAWNAWQYWQRKTALEAAALYDEIDRVAKAGDVPRVVRVWADIQQQAGGSAQAQQAGLLAARVLYDSGDVPAARQALAFVVERAQDPGVAALARLRLSAIELDAGDAAQALQRLSVAPPPAFAALFADRRGDILWSQGQRQEAREAYRQAWAAMPVEVEYRRMVEAKLNALGLDPSSTAP
jgi:predicted negative regulator of RcsB-dependent stress response